MGLFSKLRESRILLIDDDEWIRDSLSLFFESEGCKLLALETAEEALEVLEKQSYDIIITDYKLPGMDGLRFLQRIKSSHPQALKIFITAYGNEEVLSAAMDLGAQEFIKKPFTSQTIENSLSRLIERQERTKMECR